jgi:hypothetical protein
MATIRTIFANEDLISTGATITVREGSRTHSVNLTADDWKAVIAGRPLCVKADEYVYEGESFWDYWDFNSKSAGSLLVEYGDDADASFEGNLDDEHVDVHRPR